MSTTYYRTLPRWTISDLAQCPKCGEVNLPHAYVDWLKLDDQWRKVHRCPKCQAGVNHAELKRVSRDDYNYSKKDEWTRINRPEMAL